MRSVHFLFAVSRFCDSTLAVATLEIRLGARLSEEKIEVIGLDVSLCGSAVCVTLPDDEDSRVTIGRFRHRPDERYWIGIIDSRVLPRHLQLFVQDGQYHLANWPSHGGICINEKMVRTRTAALDDGDHIVLAGGIAMNYWSAAGAALDLGQALAVLNGSGLPRIRPGALANAWAGCDDVTTMIAVLRRGGALGLFGIDGSRTWENPAGVVTRWLFRLQFEERYYRIDVTRDAGADAVRACFADFPDDWLGCLAARLATLEPLERLLNDVQNGREFTINAAMQAAWRWCEQPFLMIQLLRALGHRRVLVGMPAPDSGGSADVERTNRTMARSLRRLVPELAVATVR